jgi:hypothetical protein
MKTLVTKLAIATSIALATLAATQAAYAQRLAPAEYPSRSHAYRPLQSRDAALPTEVGQGHYDGNYEFNVDQNDKASSPFAGGPG